jgi:hypothetical protein
LEQSCRFIGATVGAGVQVELARRTAKGRLRVEITGVREGAAEIPPNEWLTPLMAVYKLPAFACDECVADYSARVRLFIEARANLVAAQLQSAADRRSRSR